MCASVFIAQSTNAGTLAAAVISCVITLGGVVGNYFSARRVAARVAGRYEGKLAVLETEVGTLKETCTALKETCSAQQWTIETQGQTIVNLQTQNNEQQSQINNITGEKDAKVREAGEQRRLKHDCRGKLNACAIVIRGYRGMPLGQASFDLIDLATIGEFSDESTKPGAVAVTWPTTNNEQ